MRKEEKLQIQTLPVSIRATTYQQIGSRNLWLKKPCEDVLLVREMPELCFYGLADGQSGKQYGAAGGRACLRTLRDYIREQGIGRMADDPFPDEIPCMLTKQIRGSLLSLTKQQGGMFQDYSSTLLAIAIDPVSGQYVSIHLGDGCAIGVQKDNVIIILSPPENGITQQYTWLTTSDQAVSHLRLGFGAVDNLKRVVLLTDGASSLCRGKNISRQAQALLAGGSQADILACLKHAKLPEDDASCIVLDFEPAEDMPSEQGNECCTIG